MQWISGWQVILEEKLKQVKSITFHPVGILHSLTFFPDPGTLKMLPSRRDDVDLDFFLMFSVVDENQSWHLDENIASFCTEPDSVDKEEEQFKESNRMHGEHSPLCLLLWLGLMFCLMNKMVPKEADKSSDVTVQTLLNTGELLFLGKYLV